MIIENKEGKMNQYYLRVILILPILATLAVSCNSQKDNVYLLPEGYIGPVVILFNQADGVGLSVEDGFNIYRIPKGGVLKVKNPPTFTASNELFFYERANGERTRIEYLYPKGRGKAWEENPKTFDQIEQNDVTVFVMGRVAGTFNIKNGVIHYRSFEVGNASDSEELYIQKQDKIIEIHKQMMN